MSRVGHCSSFQNFGDASLMTKNESAAAVAAAAAESDHPSTLMASGTVHFGIGSAGT